MKQIFRSIHPDDDTHYKRMCIDRNIIESREDGRRTDGRKGTYEWWYFDSHFPNGTILIITFYSKSLVEVDGPTKPQATVELKLPDGTKYTENVFANIEECYYATDKCDVRIGESRVVGDLKHYDIKFKGKTIQAKVSLDATIEPWRSKCGSVFFGDNDEAYFAWLTAVPEGNVVADITYNGKRIHLEGTGYHDHKWGNTSMMKLIHHWYWGSAKIGDYKVISARIVGEKEYGYNTFDSFLLAKGSEIIGDNSNQTLKFLPSDEYTDEYTGKPVYGRVAYEYTAEDGQQYRISYKHRNDITRQNYIDRLSGMAKLSAKLNGYSASYLMFDGIATIDRLENGQVVESVSAPAVWELMYPGKAGADKHHKR